LGFLWLPLSSWERGWGVRVVYLLASAFFVSSGMSKMVSATGT
jgi:hypothetical protein